VSAGSYSTSSEASTDVSTSSLENLSSSARQEPQGEETIPDLATGLPGETADLTPGLLDAAAAGTLSVSATSLSSDELDVKSASSPWQSTSDAWDASTTAQPLPLTQQLGLQQQQQQQQLQQQQVDYRPVVPVGATTNSFIRQLLQNSPQYSHLLADLEPVSAAPGGGGGGVEARGSPKSALRGGGGRADGARNLPETPPSTSSASSSPRSGVLTYSGGGHGGQAVNRRLVNRYVNVDDDAGRSRTGRDKPRPSTAPSSAAVERPPASAAAPAPPAVARVQTVADPVERHRSFEVIDRVTGATLPRASAAKPRSSPPQTQHQNPHRTSSQHLPRSSTAQQQQQQQRTSPQHVDVSFLTLLLTLPAKYVMQGLCNGRVSFRPFVSRR